MSLILSISELRERCYALHIDDVVDRSREWMEAKCRWWGNVDDNTQQLSAILYNIQNSNMELQNKNPYHGVSITTFLEQMMDTLRGIWDPANQNAGPMYTTGKLTLGYNALMGGIRNPSRADMEYISGPWNVMLNTVYDSMQRNRGEYPATDAYSAQIQRGFIGLMETLSTLPRIARICNNANEFNMHLPSIAAGWVKAGEYIVPGWFREYNAEDHRKKKEKMEEKMVDDERAARCKKKLEQEQAEQKKRHEAEGRQTKRRQDVMLQCIEDDDIDDIEDDDRLLGARGDDDDDGWLTEDPLLRIIVPMKSDFILERDFSRRVDSITVDTAGGFRTYLAVHESNIWVIQQ